MLSISSGWSYQSHLRNIKVYLICHFFALLPLALERMEEQCFDAQQRVRGFPPMLMIHGIPRDSDPPPLYRSVSSELCLQQSCITSSCISRHQQDVVQIFPLGHSELKPPKDWFYCSATFSCCKKSQTIEYNAPDRKHKVLQMENTEKVFVITLALHTLLDNGIWCLQLDFHKCRLLGQTR